MPHRLKEMSAELQELNSKVAAGAPPPRGGDAPRATFSFEDKRRLSQHLGALSGDKCAPARAPSPALHHNYRDPLRLPPTPSADRAPGD